MVRVDPRRVRGAWPGAAQSWGTHFQSTKGLTPRVPQGPPLSGVKRAQDTCEGRWLHRERPEGGAAPRAELSRLPGGLVGARTAPQASGEPVSGIPVQSKRAVPQTRSSFSSSSEQTVFQNC